MKTLNKIKKLSKEILENSEILVYSDNMKSSKELLSLQKYLIKNPEQRFWQGLINWAGFNIYKAVYHEKSLQKNIEVNTTQMLVFDLIKRASFNGFDGEHTVTYLIKNKDKWVGVMPVVEDYALRDIDDDSFHIDSLLIKCKDEETAKEFSKLLKKNCSPDECSIEKDEHDYNRKAKRIIRMWWD